MALDLFACEGKGSGSGDGVKQNLLLEAGFYCTLRLILTPGPFDAFSHCQILGFGFWVLLKKWGAGSKTPCWTALWPIRVVEVAEHADAGQNTAQQPAGHQLPSPSGCALKIRALAATWLYPERCESKLLTPCKTDSFPAKPYA